MPTINDRISLSCHHLHTTIKLCHLHLVITASAAAAAVQTSPQHITVTWHFPFARQRKIFHHAHNVWNLILTSHNLAAWPPAVSHAPCHPLSLHPRPQPVCAHRPSAPTACARPSPIHPRKPCPGQIHRWIIIYRWNNDNNNIIVNVIKTCRLFLTSRVVK